MNPDGDLIGHRAAGHENGSVFTKDLGRQLLEFVDGRVDVDDIIPQLCIGDGFHHAGSWACDSVASEVNHELVFTIVLYFFPILLERTIIVEIRTVVDIMAL